MPLITLTILEKYLKSSSKNWLYAIELEQLARKNANRLKTCPSIKIQRELDLINVLRESLPPHAKIPKTAITRKMNEILRQRKYNYIKRKHYRVYANVFNKNLAAGDCYDLAFYNANCPRATVQQPFHHQDKNLASVFYLRCEENPEQPETILFGNLQHDIKKPLGWRDETLGKILVNTKNIEREMVHQAVCHAIMRRKSKVLFQAGAGLQIAQGWRPKVKKLKVTARKLKEYQKNYQKKLAAYNKLKPGTGPLSHIVWEKNSDHVITIPHFCFQPYFLMHVYFNDLELENELGSKNVCAIDTALKEFNKNRPAPKQILNNLTTVFNNIMPPELVPATTAKNLAALQEIINKQKETSAGTEKIDVFEFAELLEPFLRAWGYVEAYLSACPGVIIPEWKNLTTRYLAIPAAQAQKSVFYRREIIRPELGKTIYAQKNPFAERSIFDEMVLYKSSKLGIYKWYEERLPKILKKLGLTYKKVPIMTVSPSTQRKLEGEAWEIIDGLSEYRKKPHPLF